MNCAFPRKPFVGSSPETRPNPASLFCSKKRPLNNFTQRAGNSSLRTRATEDDCSSALKHRWAVSLSKEWFNLECQKLGNWKPQTFVCSFQLHKSEPAKNLAYISSIPDNNFSCPMDGVTSSSTSCHWRWPALPYCSSSRLQLASTRPRHSCFIAVSPSVLLLRLSSFRVGLLCRAALRASTISAVSSQYSSLQAEKKSRQNDNPPLTSCYHKNQPVCVSQGRKHANVSWDQAMHKTKDNSLWASLCSIQEALILKLDPRRPPLTQCTGSLEHRAELCTATPS